MRMGMVLKGAALAAAGLALGLGVAGTARAQATVTFPMSVTENRAPGTAGTVTVTPVGANSVRVDIRITGLPAGETRAAHIHSREGAVCDNGAPVTYPLSEVRVDASGVGTSSTTITITADKPVTANNAYVNVHEGASPPGPGVICANITSTLPVAATAAQASPRAQAPAGAPAAPRAQAPAGAPAAPRAQAPAGAPARPAAVPPARLPATGAGVSDDASAGMMAALAAFALTLSGAGVVAVSRRRK